MFSEMLKKHYIQLNLEVSDFEEAIRVTMAPMLADGVITQSYVDNIVSIYREHGPYIVITKHVALPHAPSDNGALRLGVSLSVLKTPVVSGNAANDPVKFLFGLSAPDSNSHLELLAQLVSFLSQPQFCQYLAGAQTPEDVLTIIQKMEKEGE